MLLNEIPQVKSLVIRMLDVGASGGLDRKWHSLLPVLEYIGFEPNPDECNRLNHEANLFYSRRFFPYAIGGREGNAILYTTRSIYCYSLLRPRSQWLKRFSFAGLFEETGQIEVPCTTLNALHEAHGLEADIIKLDTQGLELPILKSAGKIISRGTFCIETETGFVESYYGETTYAQVDEYLRAQGFLLFDMTVHRVGRANQFRNRGIRQPLWCECIWLRDYLSEEAFGIQSLVPNREIALKSLLICEALGCMDYALELVDYFGRIGVLTGEEIKNLSRLSSWHLQDNVEYLLTSVFRLLPAQIRRYLLGALQKSVDRPNLLRQLWGKR